MHYLRIFMILCFLHLLLREKCFRDFFSIENISLKIFNTCKKSKFLILPVYLNSYSCKQTILRVLEFVNLGELTQTGIKKILRQTPTDSNLPPSPGLWDDVLSSLQPTSSPPVSGVVTRYLLCDLLKSDFA